MNKFYVLPFCLFLLFLSMTVSGQLEIKKYSASVKPTMNFLSDNYIEGVELNAIVRSHIYSVGYYNAEEFILFFGERPAEKYNQLNFLFGSYIGEKTFRFDYQGGLGIIWGIKRTDEVDLENSTLLTNHYFAEPYSTIGIPLKIGVSYIPFSFMSIGIDFQANINLATPLFRPMFSITFGKLRN